MQKTIENVNFDCDQCEKTFDTKRLLTRQEGEHIHAVINRLERNLTRTMNKSTCYWQVLREYENKIYKGVK